MSSDIEQRRIVIKDRDGWGGISAFTMPFVNALQQARTLAFDGGGKWFVQNRNQDPFVPVGEGEINPKDRHRMEVFMAERRKKAEAEAESLRVLRDQYMQRVVSGRNMVHTNARYAAKTDNLRDVLLDLMHYAAQEGKDFAAELAIAQDNFNKSKPVW